MDNGVDKIPVDAKNSQEGAYHENNTPVPLQEERKTSEESGYATNQVSASSEKSTSETAETVPVASPQSRVSETVEVLNGHIGKRVSVISKSDIRYEGMLHVVDQSSESATIDKVRCFGTEARVTGARCLPREEIYDHVKFRLPELKDIFAHVDQCREMLTDPTVVECSMAVYPILWSSQHEDYASGFVVHDGHHDGKSFGDIADNLSIEEWNSIIVEQDSAISLLQQHVGSRNRISIISKALIRYEGLLRNLDLDTNQISLVCVRFLGTEERPAPKKVEGRSETYPSVKFQLAEARDVRVYINKMCDEMLNDHAVIVSESSLGAVYALRKRLPALTNGDSADVHMDTVNGNLRLRMGELSPRRSGDGRGIIVPVPQGLIPLSSKKAATPRRSRLFDSNPRKSNQKAQPAEAYEFEDEEDTEEESDEEMAEQAQATKSRARQGATSRKPRGGGRGGRGVRGVRGGRGGRGGRRGNGRTKSGGQRSGTKSLKRRLSAPSMAAESVNESGTTEDGEPRLKRLNALLTSTMETHSPAVYPTGNGETIEQDVSSEEEVTNGPKGPLQEISVPWADPYKKQKCPIQSCPEDYEAKNFYFLKNHFARTHPDLNVKLMLQCGTCGEYMQSDALPDLGRHIGKAHGFPEGAETNGQVLE